MRLKSVSFRPSVFLFEGKLDHACCDFMDTMPITARFIHVRFTLSEEKILISSRWHAYPHSCGFPRLKSAADRTGELEMEMLSLREAAAKLATYEERVRQLEAELSQRKDEPVIMDQPTDKLVEVPVEKLVEKLVTVPVDRVVEKQVTIPVDRVVEKSVEVPVEKIVETSVDRIVEVPVEREVVRRVIDKIPIDTLVEKMVERMVQLPLEQIAEAVKKIPVIVPEWMLVFVTRGTAMRKELDALFERRQHDPLPDYAVEEMRRMETRHAHTLTEVFTTQKRLLLAKGEKEAQVRKLEHDIKRVVDWTKELEDDRRRKDALLTERETALRNRDLECERLAEDVKRAEALRVEQMQRYAKLQQELLEATASSSKAAMEPTARLEDLHILQARAEQVLRVEGKTMREASVQKDDDSEQNLQQRLQAMQDDLVQAVATVRTQDEECATLAEQCHRQSEDLERRGIELHTAAEKLAVLAQDKSFQAADILLQEQLESRDGRLEKETRQRQEMEGELHAVLENRRTQEAALRENLALVLRQCARKEEELEYARRELRRHDTQFLSRVSSTANGGVADAAPRPGRDAADDALDAVVLKRELLQRHTHGESTAVGGSMPRPPRLMRPRDASPGRYLDRLLLGTPSPRLAASSLDDMALLSTLRRQGTGGAASTPSKRDMALLVGASTTSSAADGGAGRIFPSSSSAAALLTSSSSPAAAALLADEPNGRLREFREAFLYRL